MLRTVWLVVILALAPLGATAQDKPAYPAYYTTLTNDFADILSDEAEATINAELLAARQSRGLEMSVVTIRSRDDYAPSANIASFSKDLFNGWGIGNAERNDGILLLVAIEDREVRIALGAGYPARQDGIAARIIQTEILPAFREGRVADGILQGTRASISRLTATDAPTAPAPQVARPDPTAEVRPPEPLRPAVVEQPPEPRDVGLIARITQAIGRLSDSAFDSPIIAALIAAIISGAGFFGIRLWPQWRPRKCPECGGVMLRLGEAQEDQYLNYGQLVEEAIKSKDYGVWFCPHDEHVTVKGYSKLFSRHKACPECGFHTYETSRFVVTPASTISMGIAQLDHSCRHCSYEVSEKVSIPKVTQSSSSSGRSSSGFSSSSSSSSSFGGGSSSGGGSSGSW